MDQPGSNIKRLQIPFLDPLLKQKFSKQKELLKELHEKFRILNTIKPKIYWF
jgi:hypothetical protein